jgi:hypothetical protein
MPNYRDIPIITQLEGLLAKINAAKDKNAYEGQKGKWDQAVVLTLKQQCTLAESYRKTHADYVMERRSKCKEIIEGMESQLKKKDLIAGEYSWLEKQPAAVAKLARESNDDSKELVDALIQYRGGWPAKARECLSDGGQDLMQPFQATREKGINQEDKIIIGYRKRCDEYVTRSEEFAKQALQRQKKGQVNVDEFNSDVADIKRKMVDATEKITQDRDKKTRLIGLFEDWAKKKAWTDQERKDAKIYLPQIEAIAKEARGTVKTLTTLMDGLETRGKAAGPGWKDLAIKAVKDAKEDYTKAKESAEALTKTEESCKKTLQKMS